MIDGMDDSAAAALVVSIFVLFVAGLCFGVGCCMHARRHVLAETIRRRYKKVAVDDNDTVEENGEDDNIPGKTKTKKNDAAAAAQT